LWYAEHVLLDLTDDEKEALLDLLIEDIERSAPSPRTDRLHSIMAKVGAALEPIDPLSPLDEAVITALRDLQREGRPDVLAVVVSLFRESAPAILEDLEVAAGGTDTAALLRATHKLRGISANVGARLLISRCRELESAARMGSIPDSAVADAQAIAREYERVEAALRSWGAAEEVQGSR
jgi:HPt (histidine-containing phosphotransfer) domain-containing protein